MSTSTLIAAIDVKLADAIANPKIRYRIGNVEYYCKDYIDYLMELRRDLIKNPDAEMSIITFEDTVTEFGEDLR